MKKILLVISIILLLASPGYSAPRIFFSDLTDGNISGFDGSGTQGAAVSIWGLGFGETQGSSVVTCGGQMATVAEWSATTNPTTANGWQRITFYLNSSMALGATTITVTVNGETSQETIPFYTRNTGNIYFVANDGNNSNDGLTTSTPWLSMQQAKDTLIAGDVVYFRGGQHTVADTTNTGYFINMSNGSSATGTVNNSITYTAYPGELAVFGDGEETSTQSFIRMFGNAGPWPYDYLTFSKLKLQFWDTCLQSGTNSSSTTNYLRIVGMDATTTSADIGRGVCFWFAANEGQSDAKFWGNYVHHTGKPLDWVEADGSGYRVGPIYFQGFSLTGVPHGNIDVGWNEFAWNNGQSQFYGHYSTDRLTELKYHNNYIHHTSSEPVSVRASSLVAGGGDVNAGHPLVDYPFLTNAYIYNNIFTKNGGAMRLSDHTSPGGDGGNIYYYNNTHYGNTIFSSREINTGRFDLMDVKNIVMYTTSGSGDYWGDPSYTGTWEAQAQGEGNMYFGLSNALQAWDDALTSTVLIDPLFKDVNTDDYSLSSESTGIGAGTSLSTVSSIYTTDFYGLPLNDPTDRGAIAYILATAPDLTCQSNDTAANTSYPFTATYTLEGARTVSSCTWSNSLGGNGSCSAVGGNITGTATGLSEGDNIIIIELTDSETETGNCNFTVTRTITPTTTGGIRGGVVRANFR